MSALSVRVPALLLAVAHAPTSLWVALFGTNQLGMLDPATGRVAEWPTPGGANAGRYGIAIAPDGVVRYDESGTGRLGRVDPR